MKRFILITGNTVKHGGEELLTEWKTAKHGWIWLDLIDEEQEPEAAFLNKSFGFDEFDIIEAQR